MLPINGSESAMDNITDAPGLLERQPQITTLMFILYAIVFVVGLFGNILVLYVVIKEKSMQTVTNVFIACLSVSDLLICLFAIPFTPINALGKSWSYGEFMCKLVPVILIASVFVSTLISVMIAIHRYIVIVHPHSKPMTSRVQGVIIVVIWLLASTTAIPIGMYTVIELGKDGSNFYCHERWPNNPSGEMYTWLVFFLQVVIPAIIIGICYTAVGLKLRQRTKKRYGNGSHDSKAKQEVGEIKRNRRINRMLIAMIVIFIICWMPLDLIHLVRPLLSEDSFMTAFLFCHILAMSSVMYNPLLYAWMNDNFNKHFRELGKKVTFCCRKRDKNNHEDNSCVVSKDLTVTVDFSHAGDTDNSRFESQPMLEGNRAAEPLHYTS